MFKVALLCALDTSPCPFNTVLGIARDTREYSSIGGDEMTEGTKRNCLREIVRGKIK